ncbi:hypothetical protein OG696_40515 [Streptomyces sp. NBC_00656]|uniref:hypothetical protein n=1 Tax=Streptomyces sp. NBC_00656 TaxID=2903668 RepID=UPI003249FFC8
MTAARKQTYELTFGAAPVEQLTEALERLGMDEDATSLTVRTDVTLLLRPYDRSGRHDGAGGAGAAPGTGPPFLLVEAAGAEIVAVLRGVVAQRRGMRGPGPC